MNRSHSFNDIKLVQKYELCRQQSPCYLLLPPPQLPIFPKFILSNHSSSTLTHTDLFFIILGIFIVLLFTCLILFLFMIKLRHYHRRIKDKSVSNSLPTLYNSLTISDKLNLSLPEHYPTYYYTCESLSSKIICQNCLLETLHRKQQCFCQNFFVPIK